MKYVVIRQPMKLSIATRGMLPPSASEMTEPLELPSERPGAFLASAMTVRSPKTRSAATVNERAQ